MKSPVVRGKNTGREPIFWIMGVSRWTGLLALILIFQGVVVAATNTSANLQSGVPGGVTSGVIATNTAAPNSASLEAYVISKAALELQTKLAEVAENHHRELHAEIEDAISFIKLICECSMALIVVASVILGIFGIKNYKSFEKATNATLETFKNDQIEKIKKEIAESKAQSKREIEQLIDSAVTKVKELEGSTRQEISSLIGSKAQAITEVTNRIEQQEQEIKTLVNMIVIRSARNLGLAAYHFDAVTQDKGVIDLAIKELVKSVGNGWSGGIEDLRQGIITLGRLVKKRDGYDSAIRSLTSSMSSWTLLSLPEDNEHYAALLFNRACYRCLQGNELQEKSKDPRTDALHVEKLKTDAAANFEAACTDLIEACVIDIKNYDEAIKEADFKAIIDQIKEDSFKKRIEDRRNERQRASP